jgi:hypothetical protein
LAFEIPPGGARFTSPHPKFGVRVRVRQLEPDVDLSGEKVVVTVRGGERRTVRLTKRLALATDEKPGLYRFKQATKESADASATQRESRS